MSDDFGRRKKGGKRTEEMIKHRRKRDESEEEESEEEEEQSEREEESEEEESEQSEQSERDEESEDDDGVYENIKGNALKDSSSNKKTIEQIPVDIDELSISDRNKKILKKNAVRTILTYDIRGALNTDVFSSKKIELRASGLSLGEQKKLSEIESISVSRYDNALPVGVKVTINGLKDAKVSNQMRLGTVADVVIGPEEKLNFKEPRLIQCPTKRITNSFLEKYPGISLHTISQCYSEIQSSEACAVKKDSMLFNFIKNEMGHIRMRQTNGVFTVKKQDIEEATSLIKKHLDVNNICSLQDITVVIERAFSSEEKPSVEWHDDEEISSNLKCGPQANPSDVRARKAAQLNISKHFVLELEVVHKPIY